MGFSLQLQCLLSFTCRRGGCIVLLLVSPRCGPRDTLQVTSEGHRIGFIAISSAIAFDEGVHYFLHLSVEYLQHDVFANGVTRDMIQSNCYTILEYQLPTDYTRPLLRRPF